jgi:Ca2+-binding EF-hand superfamily protein
LVLFFLLYSSEMALFSAHPSCHPIVFQSSDAVFDKSEAFDLFDRDGDGQLSVDEAGMVLRALGWQPTQKEINDLFSGPVDKAAFIAVVDAQPPPDTAAFEASVRDAFKVFDKAGTGTVEVSELKHVLTAIGEKLTSEEAQNVLEEADEDGDGQLSVDDFLKVLNTTVKA